MYRFEVGKSYLCTSTMDQRRKRVFVCVSRLDDGIVFTQANDVAKGEPEPIVGREVVRIGLKDGFDYMVSPTVEVDLANAASVMSVMRKGAL